MSEAYEYALEVCQSIHMEIMLNPEITLGEKDRKKVKKLDKEIQATQDFSASDRFLKFIGGGISKVAGFLKEIMTKNEKSKTKIFEESVKNSSKKISNLQNTMNYLKESQTLRDEMEREHNKTEKQKQSHQDNQKGAGKPHI